ncbi:MAG: hypothetical protein EOO23_02940 [Comamonadaceae bacterium]|nr:MAG: hypothetical protein EOO23_02940 [Comamonadaceae bacterium]
MPLCLLVSYGWLLPNTTIPWIAFHRDAWIATGMSLIAITVMVRVREATPWHTISVVTLLVAAVPMLQFAAGILPFAGIAWICTAYVGGFLLAMLSGALWARRSGLQPADAFFGCVAFAATVSVWFGLYQWFDLSYFGIWVLPPNVDNRIYANLGQPNQLATLLLWGVLACGWGLLRGFIRLPVAVLSCAFFLTGIAFTQSRTALLSLIVIAALLGWWRRLWSVPCGHWAIAGLAVYMALVVNAIPLLADAAMVQSPVQLIGKTVNESRPAAWAMFLDASVQRPWTGYGWSQIHLAQYEVAPQHPKMYGRTFAHSHNLFLDLVLFMGWPLGILASLALLHWLWRQFRRTGSGEDSVLFAVVVAAGVHAMLELPLHFAYFLLPLGLVMGVMNVRNAMPVVLQTPRWIFAALCAAGLTLLTVIVIDYLEVESNYTQMRFEVARIGTLPVLEAPDVIALTQMRDILRLQRFNVTGSMSEADLQWIRDVSYFHPSLSNLHSLAVALALSGHRAEAAKLLREVCNSVNPRQCGYMKYSWKKSQSEHQELASIPGPPEREADADAR